MLCGRYYPDGDPAQSPSRRCAWLRDAKRYRTARQLPATEAGRMREMIRANQAQAGESFRRRIMQSKEQERIDRLKRRLAHLEERISLGEKTGRNMGFDKAEASALQWIVDLWQNAQSANEYRWQPSFEQWQSTGVGEPGHVIPISEGLALAFKGGWVARSLSIRAVNDPTRRDVPAPSVITEAYNQWKDALYLGTIPYGFDAFWAGMEFAQREKCNPVGDISNGLKTFTLYWFDGKTNVIEGTDIADAMRRAGFGGGSLRALDFHSHGDTRDKWKFINGHWDRV